MIYMVVKYLLSSLPEYKFSVLRLELEEMQGAHVRFPTPKIMEKIGKIVFIVETILFVAACLIFLLKCFRVIPWW